MQGTLARGAEAYYQTHVQSRSPLELVVMLYDGAVRFMTEAKDAMVRTDLVTKRDKISRTLAIVSELQSTLNLNDGGEIAASLDRLYAYINARLLDATMHGDTTALDESIRLMTLLRDAWAQVAVSAPPHAASSGL